MVFENRCPVRVDIEAADRIQFSTEQIHCVSFSNPDPDGPCARIIMHTKAGMIKESENWDNFYERKKYGQIKDIFLQADYDGENGYAAVLYLDGDVLLVLSILDAKLYDLNYEITKIFEKMDKILNRPGLFEQIELTRRELDLAEAAEACFSRDSLICDLEYDGNMREHSILPFVATKEDLALASDKIRIKKGELSLPEDEEDAALSPHDGSEGSSCTGKCNAGELEYCS